MKSMLMSLNLPQTPQRVEPSGWIFESLRVASQAEKLTQAKKEGIMSFTHPNLWRVVGDKSELDRCDDRPNDSENDYCEGQSAATDSLASHVNAFRAKAAHHLSDAESRRDEE
jgi:hypothetical protein